MSAPHREIIPRLKLLIDTDEPAALGPERRSGAKSLPEIESMIHSALGQAVLGEQSRQLVCGLILLWHDHLESAHEIAQAIDNPDGSLLHAMMHRREPDYGNAKYWLRRTGQHPCYAALATAAQPLLAPDTSLAERLVAGGRWDPYAFVDACERAARDTQSDHLLRKIQKIESEVFLAHLTSGLAA